MTGLDPAADVIVEIATLVTDDDLKIVAEGPDLVVHQPDEALAEMDDVVRRDAHQERAARGDPGVDHHRSRRPAPRRSPSSRSTSPSARTVPLCGNSIGTDRRFLAAYLPEIEEYLHYRSVDVSTLKELAKRWNPAILERPPRKKEAHRALDDIRESVDELRFYREKFFTLPTLTDWSSNLAGVTEAPSDARPRDRDVLAHESRAATPRRRSSRSRPAILRLQLPIALPGLGHVNTYALEDGDGFALVDPGLPGEASWNVLLHRLGGPASRCNRVHPVIVTHSHPDHFGGAGLLAEETGAEIVASTFFRTWWDPNETDEELESGRPRCRRRPRRRRPNASAAFRALRPPDPVGWTHRELPPERRPRSNATPTMRCAGSGCRPRRSASTTPTASPRRPGVGRRLHPGPHQRPPLPVRPRERRAAVGRPRAAHHHPPHLRAHRGRPAARLPRLARPGGGPPGRPHRAAGPRPPVHRPARPGRRHQGAPRRTPRAPARALGRPGWATVDDLSQHLFAERSWSPMAESETYAHLEHLRLAGDAERREKGDLLIPRPLSVRLAHGLAVNGRSRMSMIHAKRVWPLKGRTARQSSTTTPTTPATRANRKTGWTSVSRRFSAGSMFAPLSTA